MPAKAKILLVDDDLVSLRILRKALETAGVYEIRTATDGARGLAEALSFQPDLIISDKVMPNMDGLEFCRRVKTTNSLASTTFVILSAMTDPEARVEGLDQGADDYLVKPLSFEEVKARVRNFLRRRLPGGAESSEKAEAGSTAPLSQVLQSLVHLEDLVWPGAANRGVQAASAAEWMAESLDMAPAERPALHLAAYLQEIGKVALDPRLARLDPVGISPTDWESYRSYPGISCLVLRHVDAFQQAAALIRHQFENWDGSGFPEHLQRGQIPLGSRILRVLVDFFYDLERVSRVESRAQWLEQSQSRVGTVYDPNAHVALTQYVQQHLDVILAKTRRFVAVEDLEPGMRLAADLVTPSGTLLLRENELLGEREIAAILRHHAIDPFVFSICVYPSAEA